ncbi:MAG: LysR family transcriptional regulator [Candidatus Accumulibacter sp.]|nr:LysR family transcriptional regulator [Lewinellaceae bacterium]MCB1943120.1 LysR family transcriptional regulator [Accumulibacter sp.]
MDFTLHQLQIFLKITQTQSITKAAEELYLTQPAVSIQLKNFQRQFDIPLTEVIGRKLYITDFGKGIAEAAEKILNEVHGINHQTLAFKGLLGGRLKISVVSTGKYVMPYFLSDFMRIYKEIELVMDVTNKTKVIESLENNEVDFSLVSVKPEKLTLHTEPLMRNVLHLVANTELTFQKRPYDWSIFGKLPLIYREPGSGTRYAMEKFFDEKGLQVRKKMELTSNEAVKQAVLAGLGCSIMPLIGIKNELKNQQLQIIPVRGFPIESTWQFVWLKDKQLTPQAKAFLDFLRLQKAQIIQDRFHWLAEY